MKVQPSHDGHGNPVSFATLMSLEKINSTTYRSLTAAFEPGGSALRPWGADLDSIGPHPRDQRGGASSGPSRTSARSGEMKGEGAGVAGAKEMTAVDEVEGGKGDDEAQEMMMRSKAEAMAGHKPRAYGGHVYAQAVYAASRTVGVGFVVHSATGYFTQLGRCDLPFVYEVQSVRDGKGFCVRIVNVTQEEGKGICFSCNCSFKLPDKSPIDWQEKVDLKEKYQDVLRGKKVEELGGAPTFDTPWARNNATFAKHAHPWPGLLLKKADMAPYNTNRSALDRRSLIYYSAIGAMPSLASDPNLHACAHLYASDVNSLLMVAAHTGLEGSYSQMASLSQTVLLHTGVGGFDVGDDGQGRKWYVLEVRADRLEDGRATHKSRIWREGDGLHVGSTMQDGLIRLRFQDEEEAERARRGLRGVPVWDAKL